MVSGSKVCLIEGGQLTRVNSLIAFSMIYSYMGASLLIRKRYDILWQYIILKYLWIKSYPLLACPFLALYGRGEVDRWVFPSLAISQTPGWQRLGSLIKLLFRIHLSKRRKHRGDSRWPLNSPDRQVAHAPPSYSSWARINRTSPPACNGRAVHGLPQSLAEPWAARSWDPRPCSIRTCVDDRRNYGRAVREERSMVRKEKVGRMCGKEQRLADSWENQTVGASLSDGFPLLKWPAATHACY